MYAPRSVVTLIMAAVVLEGVTKGPAAVVTGGNVTRRLTLVFFIVLLAGIFQTAFGALRLGTFIRYIPSPVMAGFQNAVAVLIILAQVNALLGIPQNIPLGHLALSVTRIQPLTLGIGSLTALLMGFGQRLTRRVPPTILGLLTGTAVFYAFWALGYGAYLGPTLGRLPEALPLPRYFTGFGSLLADRALWPVLFILTVGAFSLAIVSSLDVLLCVRVMDGVTGERSNGSWELLRIGVANIVASGFGAIPSGLNLGASTANHRAGGRSRLAAIIAAAAFCSPWFSWALSSPSFPAWSSPACCSWWGSSSSMAGASDTWRDCSRGSAPTGERWVSTSSSCSWWRRPPLCSIRWSEWAWGSSSPSSSSSCG